MKYSNKLIFENGILAYKKCTKCGEVKKVDRFSKNKTTSTGYASQCKDCFNKRKRDLNNPNISFDALKKEYPKLGECKRAYKIPDQNIIRAGVTCKDNCIKYPCYRGIDNCKLNLALTCIRFKNK